jgi:hypothetical protein
VGNLRARVCWGCGRAEWIAQSHQALRDDVAAGVALIEATDAAPPPIVVPPLPQARKKRSAAPITMTPKERAEGRWLGCRLCGERRLLCLIAMKERGRWGRVANLAVVYLNGKAAGTFELRICTRCASVRWLAHDLENHRAQLAQLNLLQPTQARRTCGDCMSTQFFYVLAQERSAKGQIVEMGLPAAQRGKRRRRSIGVFLLAVCRRCGMTGWLAEQFTDELPEVRGAEPVRGDCNACGAGALMKVETMYEDAPRPWAKLHIFLKKRGLLPQKGVGSFSLTVCKACGLTRWKAEGAPLEPIPAEGLFLFDAGPRPRGGAYR